MRRFDKLSIIGQVWSQNLRLPSKVRSLGSWERTWIPGSVGSLGENTFASTSFRWFSFPRFLGHWHWNVRCTQCCGDFRARLFPKKGNPTEQPQLLQWNTLCFQIRRHEMLEHTIKRQGGSRKRPLCDARVMVFKSLRRIR